MPHTASCLHRASEVARLHQTGDTGQESLDSGDVECVCDPLAYFG